MPLPIPDALTIHEGVAIDKAEQARSRLPQYLVSSMLAGAYVGVAVVLLVMTSAPLLAVGHPFAKLVQGGVFGVALTLVVFAGAELFTGNNMVMLQGVWSRAVTLGDLALVWIASLVGNLAGAVAFAAMVDASGILTTGATGGKPSAFQAALASIADAKASLTGGQLFFRSVLCNFLVCLALWMAARAASDTAKLVCLAWALLAFVACGFEHSIANMTALGLAAMVGVGDWAELSRNLLYTVPGNVVGGGLLVGLGYSWIARPAVRAPAASVAVPALEGTADASPA